MEKIHINGGRYYHMKLLKEISSYFCWFHSYQNAKYLASHTVLENNISYFSVVEAISPNQFLVPANNIR